MEWFTECSVKKRGFLLLGFSWSNLPIFGSERSNIFIELELILGCGVSSPDRSVDWTPDVVNVTFGQYENTSYWYVNVSWTPLNGKWFCLIFLYQDKLKNWEFTNSSRKVVNKKVKRAKKRKDIMQSVRTKPPRKLLTFAFARNSHKVEQNGAEWWSILSGCALGSLKLLFKKIAWDLGSI